MDTKAHCRERALLFYVNATEGLAAGTKVRHSLSEHLELRCGNIIHIRRHAVTYHRVKTEREAGRGHSETQFTRSWQAMTGGIQLYTVIYNLH